MHTMCAPLGLRYRFVTLIIYTLLASACLWVLMGCSGNEGQVEPQPSTTPEIEKETVENLLNEFATAMHEEDIDRVDALLYKTEDTSSPPACPAGTAAETPEAFRDLISNTFRTSTLTAFEATEVQISDDNSTVSFLETQTAIDPNDFLQQTRVFRTTFILRKKESQSDETFTQHIARVCRQGPPFETPAQERDSFREPLYQVTTLGQVVAGAPTQVRVHGAAMTGVSIKLSEETATWQGLQQAEGGEHFQGIFTAPMNRAPPPMQVHIDAASPVMFNHRYLLRVPGEGFVQRVAGTGATRFFAVVIDPDDQTVWAGGQEPGVEPDGGGALYQVPPNMDMRDTAMFYDDLLARIIHKSCAKGLESPF